MKHVELVELEDVNLLFSKPKSSPEQWHQFLSTNPNIRNLKIIDRKFNNECFRELTTLKELRHVNIKSDLLNSSETITYAEMICENCPNLVGMTLEIFSPDDTASDDSSDVEESVEMSDEEDSELSDEDENFDTDTSF